jgi:transcriptional regulator with XRE-family HTH domain
MSATPTTFGELLRQWRQHRGRSQLALAGSAGVSTRHLSWLETGRSQPSRDMVLRLARELEVPLRERNRMLAAAGFAPLFKSSAHQDPDFAPMMRSVQALLDAHEPWPALAVDRHWHLVASNRMVQAMFDGVDPSLMKPPVNVLRLSLHPLGLAPRIVDFARWRNHVLARLRRQLEHTRDPAIARLHEELTSLPAVTHPGTTDASVSIPSQDDPEVTLQLQLRTPVGDISFLTAVTTFGAPDDVALSELAIETLLPADATSAQRLRELHALLGHSTSVA